MRLGALVDGRVAQSGAIWSTRCTALAFALTTVPAVWVVLGTAWAPVRPATAYTMPARGPSDLACAERPESRQQRTTVSAIASQAVLVTTLAATASAPDGLTASQEIPGTTLAATALALAVLTASQTIPDATVTATAAATSVLTGAQAVANAEMLASAAVTTIARADQTMPGATQAAAVAGTPRAFAAWIPWAPVSATVAWPVAASVASVRVWLTVRAAGASRC